MRLNLKDIIHVPGAMRPFSFRLDLSDLEFGGARPIGRPVTVEGRVRNMAGALVLEAEAKTVLDLTCDRPALCPGKDRPHRDAARHGAGGRDQ